MFMFPVRFAFASVLLTACLGTTCAGAMDRSVSTANTNTNTNANTNAQTAPVQYWTPGWPAGFSDATAGQGVDAYGNFPGFDGNGNQSSGFFSRRYSTTNSWAALNSTGFGLRGISPYAAFGSSLYTEGSQFGYTFKSGVALYGGIDTLRIDSGSNAFAAFNSSSSTLPVYSAHAGVAFQPTANTTLSLGFSYTQQGSDRLDSDIRSPALPGETPSAFISGRR
jgi:hypothetical protein